MRNQTEMRKRFLEEDAKMRLGHLASDLSRIASFIEMRLDANTIRDVIEEAKYFGEWAGEGQKLETQIQLAEIQGILARKQRGLDLLLKEEDQKRDFIRCLRTTANHFLEDAGFFETNEKRF